MRTRPGLLLLATVLALLVLWGIGPKDRVTWWLEVSPVLIGAAIVLLTWTRWGPYEASLIGNPLVNPDKPLEVLRTVHSFDPSLACAIHMVDSQGNEIVKVKAL